ncbi:hypothetical protein [Bradyrhizobium sp. WSM1417]|uniref:hypothetical protein n=1 Tax=Bradyrhizobium sp. WSM1417 TaxID=754500 RepID=UPI0012EBADB8|nr:hypothetical protein [Bradyrhizobium sp. WSM1417]
MNWPERETFPRRYMEGSSIAEESRITLGILSDVQASAQVLAEMRRREAEDDARFVTPATGFVWDCPELRELIGELNKLGLLWEEGGEKSGGLVPIYVVKKVTPIVRGYVEHIRVVPLRHDPSLVLYLKISGLSDVLDRDYDGVVGWHYHYCDRDGRRSDTLLSFDTRQPLKQENGRILPLRLNSPLFWERHSEGKAKFNARAERWGQDKRLSVFAAAQPDLDKFKPKDFRRPANDALPVWPQNAVLSLPFVKSR